MERVQVTNGLTRKGAAALNARLKARQVELDWSQVTSVSDEVLQALVQGLELAEYADELGAPTMSNELAERLAAVMLKASTTPRPTRRRTPAPLKLQVQPTQPTLWERRSPAGGVGRSVSTIPRDHLVRALEADLIGPYALEEGEGGEQELLELPPSRYYLTGFLAPEDERDPEDVGQDEELAAGDDEPEEETQNAGKEEPRLRTFWPASIGLSVLVPSTAKSVRATVSFAEYRVEPTVIEGRRRPVNFWRRKPRRSIDLDVPLDATQLGVGIPVPDTHGLVLIGRIQDVHRAHGVAPGTRALALFLVNRRGVADRGRRDEHFIFQVELALECSEGIVPRPNVSNEASGEWDERVADLQFRERYEYAVGHNVAVEVEQGQGPVTRVKTRWIPTCEVRRIEAHSEPGVTVAMDELASLRDADDVRAKLSSLPEAYGHWIRDCRARDVGGAYRSQTRDLLMDRAEGARQRIAAGIDLLCTDAIVLRAFCLANQAMAEAARRRSPQRYQGGKQPEWRLFQLAFVLLNLPGIASAQHPDRARVELIFFPTGGGKTEAYLGVIAIVLLLRRLRRVNLPDGGLGVAVLLRYTLRLLTLDQLGRAATLVCALESQRRKSLAELGSVRFAVGLWVGATATANTMKRVAEQVTKYRNGVTGNPCPLPNCPWCGQALGPSSLELVPSRTSPEEVSVGCLNDRCEFSRANHRDGIPVVFVDEQVYAELPSFLIATVDKFAMMPWRGEAGALFGKVGARDGRRFYGPLDHRPPRTATAIPGGLLPPELIVQDELHLISGPLGTMVGLYETAVSTLCSRETASGLLKPKIIAATATVRRAAPQIQALYGRPANLVSVFPPPGIDDSETYFARVDRTRLGRRYVGVAAQGRSMKAILLRVYRTLLAAAAKAYDPAWPADQTADGYMTLVGYFNSLRELGGMRREVDAQVLTQTKNAERQKPYNALGEHRWFKDRDIGLEPVELTSRESTNNVKSTKERLTKHYSESNPVNVLLASNMISVGVDIDRLALMVVAGQPKTTAEYIQASSRVGRQEQWPGLVVTVFNVHKPRDRSHYEHFTNYHENFYRFVEASSVTPFSGPALDRGFAGTLVAMTRFSDERLTPNRGVMELPAKRALGNEAVRAIAERATSQPELDQAAHERLQKEVLERGANLLDIWDQLVTSTPDDPKQRTYSRYDRDRTGGRPLLFQVLDEDAPPPNSPDARFCAPTSMRDVESTAHLWLVGRRFGGN